MVRSLGDIEGKRVLDFACGAGLSSLWVAERGARVTAIDLAANAIGIGRGAASALGLDVEWVTGDLEQLGGRRFDALVGRYALHHVDVSRYGRMLADLLEPGGRATFLETFQINPVLRSARRHLTGRIGIPRYGTLDERPLSRADIRKLASTFGAAETRTAEYQFARLFDRQVLHYRYPSASKLLASLDGALSRIPALSDWSYHQVLICDRVDRRR
jgi:ubiquinone/menaquinone biosynthesis C-methylase UbiE